MWMMSYIALWIMVLFETGLLFLLLRAIGELRRQGILPKENSNGVNTSGLAIGEQAPSFVATDYTGNDISLEDFQGMRRVLAFVSPGCPACASTIEVLNTLIQVERDIKVLVVGGPNRERNQAYGLEHKFVTSILTAPSTIVSETYRVSGVPFIFVLDEAGIILAKKVVNNSQHMHALLTDAFPSLVRNKRLILRS